MRGLQKLHTDASARILLMEDSMQSLLETGYRESMRQIRFRRDDDGTELSPPLSPSSNTPLRAPPVDVDSIPKVEI